MRQRRNSRAWVQCKRDFSTGGTEDTEKREVTRRRTGLMPGTGEESKRDSSTAQADAFAGANAEEKASACSARNDRTGLGRREREARTRDRPLQGQKRPACNLVQDG